MQGFATRTKLLPIEYLHRPVNSVDLVAMLGQAHIGLRLLDVLLPSQVLVT